MCKFWYWPLLKYKFEAHFSTALEHITQAFQSTPNFFYDSHWNFNTDNYTNISFSLTFSVKLFNFIKLQFLLYICRRNLVHREFFFFSFLYHFFFQSCTCDIWKFLGWGLTQSYSCQPMPQPWQNWIFNPLIEARDRTWILKRLWWSLTLWVTMGTPHREFSIATYLSIFNFSCDWCGNSYFGILPKMVSYNTNAIRNLTCSMEWYFWW